MNGTISRSITVVVLAVLAAGASAGPARTKVCFPLVCVEATVADTDERRLNGLMGAEALGERQAMLFVFDRTASYGFWMKNMKFALDLIWLDDAKRVVGVTPAVPACAQDPCPTYIPPVPVRYVVEVNAGFAVKHSIRTGDAVRF